MSTQQTSPLRFAVIGAGAKVVHMHRPALELDVVDLVAVTDIDQARGRDAAEELSTEFFADHQTLLAEVKPDVAVVVTPHPFHASIAIDCLEAGSHVLVEKPMAVHVGEADAMVEASQRTGRLLAVNFQRRLQPEILVARELIARGELGQIQHVDMRALWTRTAAYYRHAAWFGTWAGEGGGVLMNQAPHTLDLLCCLLESPAKVMAWTRTTLHTIETEDTVQAMIEGQDGSLWSLHVSTAETGLPERLEIIGTAGTVQIGNREIVHRRFDKDLRDHVRESDKRIDPLGAQTRPIDVPPGAADHRAIYQNLHEAVRHGAELACDAVEGRRSLELANALIYSGQTREEVRLPLDRDAYAALLADLQARHGPVSHRGGQA